MTHEPVARWQIGSVAVGTLVALGLLYASPLLLAGTVVPLSYVVYGALSSVPDGGRLRTERRFDVPSPRPGAWVDVTLTVENVSESTLADLRVIDGVPDELAVAAGSPRGAFALRPGESAQVTYSVVARRGDFAFDDPLVRLRPLSGAHVVTESVPVVGDETLSAVTPVEEAPQGSTTLLPAGTHPTDSGGEGLEFRSTREYRPGDPKNRIHWRRFAKTNELTTVSFREERAVRTVVVVDARPVGRVTPRPGTPTAAALCGYAGERLYEALVDGDVVTSVTALGVDTTAPDVPTVSGGIPWVDGETTDARGMARLLFAAVREAADPTTSAADDPEIGAAGSDRARTARTGPGADGRSETPGDGNGSPETARESEDRGEVATRPAGDGRSPAPDGGTEPIRRLLSQFPSTARVVFVTPLLDDWPVEFVRTLREREYPVTVVSPDATGAGTLGRTVARLERDHRLADLSATGASTVSWHHDEPIDVALAESLDHLLSNA